MGWRGEEEDGFRTEEALVLVLVDKRTAFFLYIGWGSQSVPRLKWAVLVCLPCDQGWASCAVLLLTALLSPSLPPVWREYHCSSSDDDTDVDVEGGRSRRGREPSSAHPVPVEVEDQAKGEGVGGELGIALNMCLLWALVLLCLGIRLFSGE